MSKPIYDQVREALLEALAELRSKGIECYGPFNLTVTPVKIERNNITKT